jgi:hypothetical protein
LRSSLLHDPFSFPDQISNDPTTLPRLQLVEVQTHDFRASQSTSNSNPSIAPSLQPRRLFFEAALTSS